MTGVSESSQQSSNLKDEGYKHICIEHWYKHLPVFNANKNTSGSRLIIMTKLHNQINL
ncbi:hypothetical protein ACK3F5_13270 [Photorhabdus asymbiotica UENP]